MEKLLKLFVACFVINSPVNASSLVRIETRKRILKNHITKPTE
jgi:hypothetical protein